MKSPLSKIDYSALHGTSEPLYQHIKTKLEKRILLGEFSLSERLPTEKELCAEYSVSRITIRKALEMMETDGSIRRIQGKGSFIQKRAERSPALETTPPPLPAPAPHIRQRIELRCCAPTQMEGIWETAEFRHAFEREFPEVVLSVSNAHEISRNPWSIYFSADLYAMNFTLYREALERGFIGDWRRVLGPTLYEEIQRDLPPVLVTAMGAERMPHLLPLLYTPLNLLYNKRIFSDTGVPFPRADWTEAEFFETCLQLREKADKHNFFPFLCETNYRRWPFAILREGGAVWSEDGTRCLLDSEAAIRGMAFYKQLVIDLKVGHVYNPPNDGAEHSLFQRDRAAMQLGTPAILEHLAAGGHMDWGLTIIPKGRVNSIPCNEVSMAVSPRTRNPGLVADFIRFIRRNEYLGRPSEEYYVLSASESAMRERLSLVSPRMRADLQSFLNVLPHTARQDFPATYEASQRLQELCPLFWMDLANAPAHCHAICEEINAMPELILRRRSE